MESDEGDEGVSQESVLVRYDGHVVTARDPVTGWEATATSKGKAVAALAAAVMSNE